jgi:transposase
MTPFWYRALRSQAIRLPSQARRCAARDPGGPPDRTRPGPPHPDPPYGTRGIGRDVLADAPAPLAYAGFAGLYEADPLTGAPAQLTEVACWAHARRKIYDIHVETKSPAGAHSLEMIARLFAIEADIKGRPPAERLAARRAKATPILSELRAFLDATMEKISGKSSLAGAFRYATSRWTALTRYVGDGRLEMSNNVAERAMRPLALGRKNYLFAGSDEGGRRAAIIYTLIETARLNDVDPEAWLGDIISRIADHPNTKIDELLPWKWTRPGSQAIAA